MRGAVVLHLFGVCCMCQTKGWGRVNPRKNLTERAGVDLWIQIGHHSGMRYHRVGFVQGDGALSLISKVFSAIVAVVLIYAFTYWVSGSWESSLVIAVGMGALSAIRMVGALRKTGNSGMTSTAAWYYFGTLLITWIVFVVVNWLVHR